MAQDDDGPKIHVDSDWKAQAQAEKERLAKQSQTAAPTSTPGTAGASGSAASAARSGAGGLPPATFDTLVQTTATQALFALGAIPDPRTGQRMMALDLARHHIDTLVMLEEKTKGNLSQPETDLLAGTLYELRSRYIQAVQNARGY